MVRLPALELLANQEPEPPSVNRLEELWQYWEFCLHPKGFPARSVRHARAFLRGEDEAVFLFEAKLTDADPFVRGQAAMELGVRGHVPSMPLLLWRFREESDPALRLGIGEALIRMGNHSVLPWILGELEDPSWGSAAARVARVAVEMTGGGKGENQETGSLRDALRALWHHWRETGWSPVPGGGGPPQLDTWTRARLAREMLALTSQQLREVDRARTVLVGMGRLSLPLLELGLDARDPYLRFHSLEVVRDLGPAARALGQKVVDLLDDSVCRITAVETLGAVGPEGAFDLLVGRLQDPDLDLAAAAAEALGYLGDPRAIPGLRERLRDPAAGMDLRVRAAFSLALLDPTSEGRTLLEAWRRRRAYHEPTLENLLEALERRREEGETEASVR